MHFRFEHDFDIDAKDYWELFFSEPYNVDLYKRLGMRERVIVENKDEGATLRRVVRLTPNDEVPAAFKAFIHDTSYTEHDLYRKDRSLMEVSIEPAMMKNKFELKAVYGVSQAGAGRARRTFEGDIKVSVMIIGGQIEKYMVEKMRASYEVAAAVTREWIPKWKAVGASGSV